MKLSIKYTRGCQAVLSEFSGIKNSSIVTISKGYYVAIFPQIIILALTFRPEDFSSGKKKQFKAVSMLCKGARWIVLNRIQLIIP
jgi:hypothetical protein